VQARPRIRYSGHKVGCDCAGRVLYSDLVICRMPDALFDFIGYLCPACEMIDDADVGQDA
jgi:hypothetical protein